MASIPEKLLKLRKGHNLSQEFVASKLGIDVFDYMAIENGRNKIDKVQLLKLANIYEISEEELAYDTKDVRILNLGNKFKEEVKKNKKNSFVSNLKKGQYNMHLFVIGVALIFLIAVVVMLPKPSDNRLTMVQSDDMQLTANTNTVVYIDKGEVIVSGKDKVKFEGLNSPVKVVSGVNYFAALGSDGRVYTSGFNVKYQKEIEKIKNAVDIESGNSHILVLLSNGKVKCIGNNDHNQCEVSSWKNVNKIIADENGSVGFTDNEMLVAGLVPYADRLNSKKINMMEFDNEIMCVLYTDGTVDLFGDSEHSLDGFENIKEIAIDNDFIAGVKNNGELVISSDNYLLSEKAKYYTSVKTIESGSDYLMIVEGDNLYGIGSNKYNQFVEKEYELKSLPAIENFKIETGEEEVTITFDLVPNAQTYILTIDELEFETSVSVNKITLPKDMFENDVKYIFMLTARNNFDLYLDSEIKYAVFSIESEEKKGDKVTDEKDEPIVLEIPVTLTGLNEMTAEEFENYLVSFGYDRTKFKKEKITDCEHKGELISFDGISEGESLTKTELKNKEITYKYCEVEVN